MPKEAYVLFGTFFALAVAYITAKINSRTQLNVADKNFQKEIVLQENKLLRKSLENEVRLERKRLEKLHKILSKTELENSLTMSYMQSSSKLNVVDFRIRYLESCERLHTAQAIIDLYYPEMSEMIKQVYGEANVFWGSQEGVLRTDVNENSQKYEHHISKVQATGDKISGLIRSLKYELLERGKKLNEKI